MRLLPEKLSLVFVGAFNPAIINPSWIAANVLGLTDERPVQVEMLAPVNVGAGLSSPVRYEFEGLAFSVTSQRLIFFLNGLTPEGVIKVVRTSRGIFSLLHHTPVTGMGFNFSFVAERPSQKLENLLASDVQLLDQVGEDASIAIQKWSNTIKNGDELITVSCANDSNNITVDVNFHRNVSDTAALVAVLENDQVFGERLEMAKLLATSLNEGELE